MTMRVLVAAEGESDELVAERILLDVDDAMSIVRKKFPSRGFAVVKRSIDTLVRAAHYGLFDVLVVHFDLNNSLPAGWKEVSESPRWKEIHALIQDVLPRLTPVNRDRELATVLMTPCKSTEAWLTWARHNEDGQTWESKDRHLLKRQLFGDPPRGMIRKSEQLSEQLITQMHTGASWPKTLVRFVNDLRVMVSR